MSKIAKAWVVGETADSFNSLLAVGSRLAESVETWSIGSAGGLLEDGIAAFVAAVGEQMPDVVLFQTTRRMRLVAAHLAAAQGTCVVNDTVSIDVDDDGAVVACNVVYGGSATRTQRIAGSMAIVLLSEGLLVNEPAEGIAQVDVQMAEGSGTSGITFKGASERQVESVNLVAARNVVSVGRGIEKQEDLEMVGDFARAVSAEIGCTRPIAEGVNWLSRERYIGVSGVTVKPNIFVAVGVSGQIQHMVGATSSSTIIAVNKDKNAPIFKYADYGIVGDYAEVLPKLTEKLQG